MGILEEYQTYLWSRTGTLLPTYGRQGWKAGEWLGAALGKTHYFHKTLCLLSGSHSAATCGLPQEDCQLSSSFCYCYDLCPLHSLQLLLLQYQEYNHYSPPPDWPHNKAGCVYFDLCYSIVHIEPETKLLGMGNRINNGLCSATNDGLCWLFNKSNGTCHK